ncbi:6940_t:CDS:10, partial [Acaulospora morrowiae]
MKDPQSFEFTTQTAPHFENSRHTNIVTANLCEQIPEIRVQNVPSSLHSSNTSESSRSLKSPEIDTSLKQEISESSFIPNERPSDEIPNFISPENDLSYNIPGLYRLLDLCKDDGSNGLVDKIIISKESLKKFCNKMVPSSYRSISEINYEKLDSISVNLVGCYGNYTLIAKLLHKQRIIDERMQLLVDSQSQELSTEKENIPSLRPGIYLLMVHSKNLGLVINWPEPGCYEENISSQRKKNMINLHRYLTKLTDYQLCLMSESDLECFIWNSENEGEDDSEEEKEGVCYEFEVKKSQEEQEDFKIFPGFQIYLPQQMISDIRDGYPLQPTVVESVTSQTLITKKKITATSKMMKNTLNTEYGKFKEDFGKRLDGYALRINKNMSIQNLEILIKNGLPEIEKELLGPYRKELEDAKTQIEHKKAHERDSIKEDAEIFTKYVWKKLREEYIEFELLINKELTNNFTTQQVHNDETMKQNIFSGMDQYGDTQSQLSNDVRQSMCQLIFDMFMDKELDYNKLIKKYFVGQDQEKIEEKKSSWSLQSLMKSLANIFRTDNSKFNRALHHAETSVTKTSDRNFINEIISMEFESLSKQKHEIIDLFLKEYESWKRKIFPGNIQAIVPKYNESYMKEVTKKFDSEYLRSKEIIEEKEFNRICKEIENKFSTGHILKILNLYESFSHIKEYTKYLILYEIETIQPDQLKITIYQTSFNEGDNFQLSEDEFHVPPPKFNNQYSGDIGNSFQINPETHDIRNISQFENKFFLALWNNKENRLEIYFDTASRLSSSIPSSPFKILYAEKNSFISVNEPKGLIGFYNVSSGVLNVYVFDEKFVTLIPRATNVQLVQCNTEENDSSDADSKTEETDSPDADSKTEETDSPDADGPLNINGYNSENQVKMLRAHVFFCANFGSPAIIPMPKNMQSVEHFQFSYIKKQQMHLTTLDVVKGQFCSLVTRITLEKTQYKFQQRSNKKSMGKVRISTPSNRNDSYSFLVGRDTQFSKNVLIGESIVIQNEKRCVLEIQSNTKLKIAGTFSNIADPDSWMDFRIEPKTNLNSFVNVYQYMFEKYPIDSCIDTEINRSLSLTIALDLSSRNVEDYEERFRDYIDEMFEELKRSTKKPANSLKKFNIDVMTFFELNMDDPDFQENKFTSLKELKKTLEKQEAKYTNARTFLQNTKMIMAKIKTCDWGSLDDNLVQIRVSTLKRLLQTAISIGVEENNPTFVSLMNHDTGTKIDDPVIELPKISEDFDNPREILSDEDILLFEENTDFAHLSADLRILEDKRNCQKVCAKEIGHEDSEHMCQSKRHYCGKPCSLSTCTKKGNYQCPNKCITACEEEHDDHRCENETCPIQCPIPEQEHQCLEYCEEPGICRVLTEPQRQEETYQGKVSETVITFTKYIQLSERSRCYKKIPPNKFKHEGRHSHSQDINSFHFCDAKCQYCEYYCILPYGHTQSLHETKHGNMIQTEFTSEDQNFEYAGTGAVYSAVYAFIKARLASQSSRPQIQAANKDTISLILFDHEVIVPFENHVLTDADVLLNHMIKHEARGGTDFNLAIQKAGFLINQYYDANRANVIIFLSDGGSGVPRDQLRRICEHNKSRGNPLFLYTVLFANRSESSSLKEMAKIAQEYQPPNSSASSLRCQYNNVMTEINLVTTFTGVAE